MPEFGGQVPADATAAGMIAAVASHLSLPARTLRRGRTTKSTTPCVFCGRAGSPSTEHVVPRWLRKALQIREPVREFSGTAYVGAAETLAIVFHEVCVSCNTGCLESLEERRAQSSRRCFWEPRRVRRTCWIPISRRSWQHGR